MQVRPISSTKCCNHHHTIIILVIIRRCQASPSLRTTTPPMATTSPTWTGTPSLTVSCRWTNFQSTSSETSRFLLRSQVSHLATTTRGSWRPCETRGTWRRWQTGLDQIIDVFEPSPHSHHCSLTIWADELWSGQRLVGSPPRTKYYTILKYYCKIQIYILNIFSGQRLVGSPPRTGSTGSGARWWLSHLRELHRLQKT